MKQADKSRSSRNFLRRFMRDEDGVIAIEAAIVLPMMFWAFLTVFAIFDTFRVYSINQKAAYTLGDAISRETLPIDDNYLTGAKSMFDYMAEATGATSIRVSSIYYRENGPDSEYILDWSQTRGSAVPLQNRDIEDWAQRLPRMVDQERLILVETWNEFDPPFKTGLERRSIEQFVFTRPRYTPRVCWQVCN
jgi:hypothetical protein